MRGKILLVLSLFLMLTLVASIPASAQSYLPSADNDYDALDTLEEEYKGDLEEIYDQKIQRIRKGDPHVLRIIVYEEFEAIHKRIKDKVARMSGEISYYEYIGKSSALNAYFGGLENQDPKNRLKSIGFLADYVDEVRADYEKILKAVNARLKSNDETRREVEFALKILRAKIERRRILARVKKGDMKVLQQISPDKFLILVANQKRLQIEWCYETDIEENDIVIRSVNLDYYAYETNKSNIAEDTEFYERLNKDFLTADIDYKVSRVGDPFKVTAPYVDKGNIPTVLKVLLTGLANDNLFVREECAYVFLDIVNDRRYDAERVDTLKQVARSSSLTTIIKKAFDDVKYSYYEWADYRIGESWDDWNRRVPTWVVYPENPPVDKDFRTRPNYVILLKLIMNQTDLEWYHTCDYDVSSTKGIDLHVKTLFKEDDSAEWRIDELSGEVLKRD